ncbi:MAG: hypothetical protein K5770_02870 [Lachnospiraceae bacterium]|nr:hypothetical protein [Lachnospiraceae bacterium]
MYKKRRLSSERSELLKNKDYKPAIEYETTRDKKKMADLYRAYAGKIKRKSEGGQNNDRISG